MKKITIKDTKVLFVILHVLFSFILERKILIFSDNPDVILTQTINPIISDRLEMIVCYCLSKVIAVFLIYLIWNTVFSLMERQISWNEKIFFVLVFFIGTIIVLVFFPESWGGMLSDNYVTYLYAKRLIPYYWHSIYTTCFFVASMMVFPSAFSISIMQWFLFSKLLAYVYGKLRIKYKWGALGCLIVFFLPGIYFIILEPYRPCIYAIVCGYAVIKVICEVKEKKPYSFMEWCVFIWLISIVALWRSEGIILGIGLFAIRVISLYRAKFVKYIVPIGSVMIALILLSLPQKMGDIKYFGNDYFINSTMAHIQGILKDKDSNLEYAGAEKDLEAISKITPLSWIQTGGVSGYYSYNYSCGRLFFNQSTAPAEIRDAYVRAYRNLVSHNIRSVARTQMNLFLSAIRINYQFPYSLREMVDAPDISFEYNQPYEGYTELIQDTKTEKWVESSARKELQKRIQNIIDTVWSLTENIHLSALVIVANLLIIIIEGIKSLRKRKDWLLCGLAIVVFAQILGIALFMPCGNPKYLCAYDMEVYMLCVGMLLSFRVNNHNEKTK